MAVILVFFDAQPADKAFFIRNLHNTVTQCKTSSVASVPLHARCYQVLPGVARCVELAEFYKASYIKTTHKTSAKM